MPALTLNLYQPAVQAIQVRTIKIFILPNEWMNERMAD
jgi:hypothetical protein